MQNSTTEYFNLRDTIQFRANLQLSPEEENRNCEIMESCIFSMPNGMEEGIRSRLEFSSTFPLIQYSIFPSFSGGWKLSRLICINPTCEMSLCLR